MRESRWFVKKTNPAFLSYFSQKAAVSKFLGQILINRGIKTPEKARTFLSPTLEQLYDPFLLPDMDKAVQRIRYAALKKESVLIFGDYDADGISSTAIMLLTFGILGIHTDYYLPDRLTEGYGLNLQGIRVALKKKADLIITVDCGINAFQEIEEANLSGVDVIITDHHLPSGELPRAAAVLNPHRKDSIYPFKDLAGAGVAFKLSQALLKENADAMLDLAALGTIGDSVPLIDENRIIAFKGIKKLNTVPRTGITALKKIINLGDEDLTSSTLAFRIIPRINSIGRLTRPNEAVELLLTQDKTKAEAIASNLEKTNKKRQEIEEMIYASALEQLDTHHHQKAIILSSTRWHPGVTGIVASRLAERFYRPVFLFSLNETIARGSARSIPPVHLYKVIAECQDILDAFGGHSQAAGLRLSPVNIDLFRSRMNRILEDSLSMKDLAPTVSIDLSTSLREINIKTAIEISKLEPFGHANDEPLIGVKGVIATEPKIVGKSHLKMRLHQGSAVLDTIGFGMGEMIKMIEASPKIDAVFSIFLDNYKGITNLRLNLKAIRQSITG